MKTCVTGDIHGDPSNLAKVCSEKGLTCDDVLILLGDVGANYFGGKQDRYVKWALSMLKPTILSIHGNHEARPETIPGYHEELWYGGIVYVEDEFPTLLFARDGEIFNLNGLSFMAIGGAYSVDKQLRLARGWKWFPDEQPSEKAKRYVEKQLKSHHVDVVLSHTCPAKYIPTEAFIPGIDQSEVDYSTEAWLDHIEDSLPYRAWYCGHWHINKKVDKMNFLFHDMVEIPTR